MAIAFKAIDTLEKLAEFFGYPSYKRLARVVYGSEGVYSEFEISKKSGGVRRIQAPSRRLRSIQRILATALQDAYRAPQAVHGFRPKFSIITNADVHVGKDVILNVDLQDFFTSIKFHHVKGLFRGRPFRFPDSVATVLAQICCHEKCLPQGAPTSPVVSNFICLDLDREVTQLAKGKWCAYTRYADDLTFSFQGDIADFPPALAEVVNGRLQVGDALERVLEKRGFSVNSKKLRLEDQSSRMVVTGLTINSRRNVSPRYLRQVDAMLHAWERWEYGPAQDEFNREYDPDFARTGVQKDFASVLAGKLSFLLSVRGIQDPTYRRLAGRFNDLVEDGMPSLPMNLLEVAAEEQRSTFVFETASARYSYVKQLGVGGCGTVVSAVDGSGTEWAIKYLTPEGESKEKRKRFTNELAFCSETRHPRIMPATDHGIAEVHGKKCPFYVMPRLRENLETRMKRGIDAQDVVPLFIQVVEGVESIHSLGVVHRDLKPKNILLTDTGDVVVADFGIAQFDKALMQTMMKTSRRSRVANWAYHAPEQRVPGPVDAKADVFALGLILNEMFTGQTPYGSGWKLIGDVAPEFADLDPIVDGMLRQDPAERLSLAKVKQTLLDRSDA